MNNLRVGCATTPAPALCRDAQEHCAPCITTSDHPRRVPRRLAPRPHHADLASKRHRSPWPFWPAMLQNRHRRGTTLTPVCRVLLPPGQEAPPCDLPLRHPPAQTSTRPRKAGQFPANFRPIFRQFLPKPRPFFCGRFFGRHEAPKRPANFRPKRGQFFATFSLAAPGPQNGRPISGRFPANLPPKRGQKLARRVRPTFPADFFCASKRPFRARRRRKKNPRKKWC